jgi:hypothetical protein
MPIPVSATAAEAGIGADAALPPLVALASDGVPRHVVICLLNGMGDAFLALPLIRFVIERFGRDRVSVWANAYHARTVYAELGDVVVATAEDNRNVAAAHKEAELASLRHRLPKERALSWVSLNPYEPRTEVEDYAIAALATCSLWEFRGAGLRIDAATGAVLHRMDQYFRVIGERRTPTVDRRPVIGPVAQHRAAAIRDHIHQMSKQLVAVHAQTRPGKCWPESSWRALGGLLRHECELVLLGLPGQALVRGGDYLAAPEGWEKQIAILAHADAFIGIDSCFSHLADAFGLPGVVLYGDRDQSAPWRPKGPTLEPLFAGEGGLERLAPAKIADLLHASRALSDLQV